jgi:hypothetical protein
MLLNSVGKLGNIGHHAPWVAIIHPIKMYPPLFHPGNGAIERAPEVHSATSPPLMAMSSVLRISNVLPFLLSATAMLFAMSMCDVLFFPPCGQKNVESEAAVKVRSRLTAGSAPPWILPDSINFPTCIGS